MLHGDSALYNIIYIADQELAKGERSQPLEEVKKSHCYSNPTACTDCVKRRMH